MTAAFLISGQVSAMTRREAREEVLSLVFEASFRPGEPAEEIYAKAAEMRGLSGDEFVRSTFFGITGNLADIDAAIERHSNGWKVSRISPVSLAIMRLAVYEIRCSEDVPARIAVNEALELVKKYDDADKVRPFVNGVLNAVMKEGTAG